MTFLTEPSEKHLTLNLLFFRNLYLYRKFYFKGYWMVWKTVNNSFDFISSVTWYARPVKSLCNWSKTGIYFLVAVIVLVMNSPFSIRSIFEIRHLKFFEKGFGSWKWLKLPKFFFCNVCLVSLQNCYFFVFRFSSLIDFIFLFVRVSLMSLWFSRIIFFFLGACLFSVLVECFSYSEVFSSENQTLLSRSIFK